MGLLLYDGQLPNEFILQRSVVLSRLSQCHYITITTFPKCKPTDSLLLVTSLRLYGDCEH